MCAAAVCMGSPLRYTIDAGARLLAIEILSIADGSALVRALRDVQLDPQFRASYHVCVDCNSLPGIPSVEDVKRLARLCVAGSRSEAPSRWAFIATWRPIYDVARTFITSVSAPSMSLRLFYTWSDARIWLGTTMPAERDDTPWIGPSRALNELIRASRAATR